MSSKLKRAGYGISAAALMLGSGIFITSRNAMATETLTLVEDTVLTDNVTGGILIEAGKNVTLDLNGYSVTNDNTSKAAIINKGTLTIKGTGNVSSSQPSTAAVTNYPDAMMTIEGGEYTSDQWYIIRNYGTMIIEDGTKVVAHESNTNKASMVTNGWYGDSDRNNGDSIEANSGESEPQLIISGGEFTAGLRNCSVIKNDDYSNLVIDGGKFTQPKGSLADCDSVILNWNVAEINDGEFYSENGPVISNGAYTGISDKGQITITGGTYTIGKNGSILGYGNGGNSTGLMTISGGVFAQGVSATPTNPSSAESGKFYEIKISGGVFGTEPSSELIAEGKTTYKIGDNYIVGAKKVDVEATKEDDMEGNADRDNVEKFVSNQLADILAADNYVVNEDGDIITDSLLIDAESLQKALIAGDTIHTLYEQQDFGEGYDEETPAEIANNVLEVFKEFDEDIYGKIVAILGDNGKLAGGFSGYVDFSSENAGWIGSAYKLDNAITVTYELPKEAQVTQEGYTRTFYIIRLHYNYATNEYEVKMLPATRSGDTLAIESDEFSTFLVAYTDTEIETEQETEEVSTNPNTFDKGGVAFAIAAGSSLPMLIWGAYLATKRN